MAAARASDDDTAGRRPREQHDDAGEKDRNLPDQPERRVGAAQRNPNAVSQRAQQKGREAGDSGHRQRGPEFGRIPTPRPDHGDETEHCQCGGDRQGAGVRGQWRPERSEIHRRIEQATRI